MDFLCSTCEMPKLFLLSTSVLTTIRVYSVWIQHPWHHLTSDRSYHNDLCILSIAFIWNYWLKQASWLGRKCYHSRVNNILHKIVSKEVGSLDQCRKLSDKATTQNTYISLLVSWQFICFLPCEEYRSLSS